MTATQFTNLVKPVRFDFCSEKNVQQQVKIKLTETGAGFIREHKLDAANVPDLFFPGTGLVVEVKIKGSKKEIYRQLERYSRFNTVKEIILLTNKAMTLPRLINNKPATVLKMGTAWL